MEEGSKGSAATKRTKFRRTGGSKYACSWSSSAGSTSAHHAALIASLLSDLSSEVIFEDERQLHPALPIRASSIRALVRLCVQSFNGKGEVREELGTFPRTLFLMHQWFTSSPQFAFLFISSWEAAGVVAPCSDPTCPHFVLSPTTSSESSSSNSSSLSSNTHPPCRTQRFKAQVIFAIRFWINNFPMHFGLDEKLQESIASFRERLEVHESALLDLTSLPNYDWIRNMSMRDPEGTRPSRKVSLVFNHLEPKELALHLTVLEHKIIRRITFEDLKSYSESGTLEEVPKLERSVSIFNGLSQWIQCVVLSRPTPAQRADVIVKFVHVAQNLRKLQNFNSLMGVVGSLSHSALARLTKTMECVPVEERKALKDLTTLISSAANFSAYRKALAEARGFKIPILGVHLKDLISLHTALPDYVEGGLINFRKMSQLSGIFTELDNMAQSMPPAQASMDLLNTLKVSLDLAYSEDEIYELSLAREPKTSVSPTRSPGLGAGDTVGNVSYEKQLQSMVEAVFKNYDANHDGFISKEEFQQICTNHPAIDAFFVLDENRDGMISKLELERYLRNKKNAARHNFIHTTYFKPTFCIHCSGLLWGLIRQGYKCRNCGVNAHKYCKEYMLHECKLGPLLYFPSPEPHVKRKGFRIRKKSSSQSESGSPPSPKLFNSLEQLSLSAESTDLPVPSPAYHTYSSSDHGSSLFPSSFAQNKLGGGGTPKSPRRLSSVLTPHASRRPSTSVPSSPKLGFSLPLWSPCKSLFHPPPTATTTHAPSPHHSHQHPTTSAANFVSRTGQGLGKLFGSPSASPQLSKGRKAPPSPDVAQHPPTPPPPSEQGSQRQHIGGVH